MTRRILMVFLALAAGLTFTACAAASTESPTTGTYFILRQNVFDQFSEVPFSTFSFIQARHYPDSGQPLSYETISGLDGDALKSEVAGMFERFNIGNMFIGRFSDFGIYEIFFGNGAETLTVLLSRISEGDDWIVSFIYCVEGTEIVSQYYWESAFPDQVGSLLDLLNGVVEA